MAANTIPQEALEALISQHHETIEWVSGAQYKPVGAKNPKVEPRFVAVTQSRIHTFSYTATKPRLLSSDHFFELKELKSQTPRDLQLQFKNSAFALESFSADLMLATVLNAWHRAFKKPPHFVVSVEPQSRLPQLVDREAACGALAAAYDVCANYLNVPFRGDIAWDIDRILHAQKLTRLGLAEFEALGANDIRALLFALRFNTFFKTLDCNDMPLGKEKAQLESLVDTVRGNSCLETLCLRNIAAKPDFWAALFTAMMANRQLPVNDLDLAGNQLDSQGFTALAKHIEQAPHGIAALNLCETKLDKSAAAILSQAFRKNPKVASSLTALNLSYNKLDLDGSAAISAFLSSPNAITTLNLRSTSVSVETLVGALLRGCQELRRLDLSGNKISAKAVPQMIQWIKSSSTLKALNLSNTGITAEAFRDMVQTIGQNLYLEDVTVKASENEFESKGGVCLAAGFDEVKNIKVLDLSDNSMGDEGVSAVAEALILNEGVHTLDLSGNLSSKSSKHNNNRAIECLIALLESECPLESLALRGSKTNQPKLEEMLGFIYAVGVNDSLLELDISNNNLGLKGAMALGKVLQTNKTLSSLTWDDNNTPMSGFQAFCTGLTRNRSLKNMPLPMNDIAVCSKESMAVSSAAGHQFSKLILEIQAVISRNQNPSAYAMNANGEFSGGTAGGLLLLTTGHQATADAQLMKIKRIDAGKLLDSQPQFHIVVEDTQRADKLTSSFQLIREETQSNLQLDMNKMLKEFATQVAQLVATHKVSMRSKTVELMTNNLKSLEPEAIRRLGIAIEYGSKSFDQTTLEKILVNAAGAEIMNKAVECFASAAELTTEYMYEKLLDSLDEIYEQIQSGSVNATAIATGTSTPSLPVVAALASASSPSVSESNTVSPRRSIEVSPLTTAQQQEDKTAEEEQETAAKEPEQPPPEAPKESEGSSESGSSLSSSATHSSAATEALQTTTEKETVVTTATVVVAEEKPKEQPQPVSSEEPVKPTTTPPKPIITAPKPAAATTTAATAVVKPAAVTANKPAPVIPPRSYVGLASAATTTAAAVVRPTPTTPTATKPPTMILTGATSVSEKKAAIAAALSQKPTAIPGSPSLLSPRPASGIQQPTQQQAATTTTTENETSNKRETSAMPSQRNLSDKKALLAATFARAGALGMRPGGGAAGPRSTPLPSSSTDSTDSHASSPAAVIVQTTAPVAPAKPRVAKKPDKNSVLSKATATPAEPAGPALTQLTKDRAKLPSRKAGSSKTKSHGRRPPTRVARPLAPPTSPTTTM